MTPEVSTGDARKLFCLNCARKIVSPKTMSKYERLKGYLKFRAAFTDSVKLSFAQIDGVIGDNLPMSAYRSESWWENSVEKAHAKAWLEAGWKVSEVNLREGYVVFHLMKDSPVATSFKRRTGGRPEKPFKPASSRIIRKRKPSKTKISKLYARLKNIERQKIAPPKLRGNFKPKSVQEKKLFKPKENLNKDS